MGVRNYLIEGVSGAGKTAVAEELQRRGRHVIHGDRELAYLGDPDTGEALTAADDADIRWRHEHWIWDARKVRSAIADPQHAQSFFCGGSRNHRHFVHLFDAVFVLDLDSETLDRRLAQRPADEFGGQPDERRLIARVHATREDLPANAASIDAKAPLAHVVDDTLARCAAVERGG